MERIVILQQAPLDRRGTSRFVFAVRFVVLGSAFASLFLFLFLPIAGPGFCRRFRLRRRRLNIGLAPGLLSGLPVMNGSARGTALVVVLVAVPSLVAGVAGAR